MSRRGKSAEYGSELLANIEAVVSAAVKKKLSGAGVAPGLMEAVAAAAGEEAAEDIRIHFGGMQVYINQDKARQDAAIYDAFTGDNIHELVRRFHLSESMIYRIIKNERERRRIKQGSLLDLG